MTRQTISSQERLSALVLALMSLTGLGTGGYHFVYKGVFFSDIGQQFAHRPIGTTIGTVVVGLFVGACIVGLGMSLKALFAK